MPAKQTAPKALGTRVEFSSGESITVLPWGWAEVESNFKVITDIVADATRSGLDLTQEGELQRFVLKQFNRVKGLIVASLENGQDDLDKVRGIDGIVDVIDAMLEENGVFKAMGKLMSMMDRFTKGTTSQS